MTYIDGFVAAVPTANKVAYIEHARTAATVLKENGAIELVECWGDDVPDGEITSMPKAVKCRADETIVFSWIVWPSREVRDTGIKAAMQDPRVDPSIHPLPFDSKRIIFGGFDVVLDG